jgi:hypothetical protein
MPLRALSSHRHRDTGMRPDDVDDGILVVRAPKPEQARARRIDVGSEPS